MVNLITELTNKSNYYNTVLQFYLRKALTVVDKADMDNVGELPVTECFDESVVVGDFGTDTRETDPGEVEGIALDDGLKTY